MIRIIGIDVAVQHKNIGIVVGNLENDVLIIDPPIEVSDAYIESVAESIDPKIPTLLALDAPLGWPTNLSVALSSHLAGKPLQFKADDLFRRTTDNYVCSHYDKRPLDVGSNLIARTAHSALEILNSLGGLLNREIQLAWDPKIENGVWAIEVYPAATLLAHGIKLAGYKSKKDLAKTTAARKSILRRLRQIVNLHDEDDCYITRDHCLDAAICVLAGKDFLEGHCDPPDNLELAKKEGWIWVRMQNEPIS